MKQVILDAVHDQAIDLVVYDRKDDAQLPVGAIEAAIKSGEITIDEILDNFRTVFVSSLDL